MLKCVNMLNVSKVCCICSYSVIKTVACTVKFCSQSMYVVALLGVGGGGGNWCGHPRQHSTRDSIRNSKINLSNLRKHHSNVTNLGHFHFHYHNHFIAS
jgi:hypothetical protein